LTDTISLVSDLEMALAALERIESHATPVTAAEVTEAAAVCGWLPGDEDRTSWPLLRAWASGGA
jgi:hypothetical protein